MKLWKKILLIAVISVISLFALVILGLSIAKPIVYSEYTQTKEIECKIPGLAEGYVPQGVCYVESKEAYIFSGYNEENVAIYVVKDGNVAEIISVNADGSRTESHGGGVATAGNYVYVTNEETVLVYNLSKLMDAKDGEEVEVLEERVAQTLVNRKVKMCRIESNRGGSIFAQNVQKRVNELGSMTSITTKWTQSNKETRIHASAGSAKSKILFLDEKAEGYTKEYRTAMTQLCTYSISGKNPHDDVPDALSLFVDWQMSDRTNIATIVKRPF